MKLLFVHDLFGAHGGAETNIFATGAEFKQRGHVVGMLHGPGTGRNEAAWRETFYWRFPLAGGVAAARATLLKFKPDIIYVHKLADLDVLEAIVKSGVPCVRFVHDHELYCMRSYKYHPLTRAICHRPVSLYCLFPCGACVARNRASRFPFKWVSYLAKKREIRLNRQFQRLVVYSEYSRQELIRNGFDPRRIEIHVPMRLEPGGVASSFSSRNLILYAGQIIRGKGVDVLLESLAQVQVPFECLILGDGSHRAYCENLSRELGLTDRVRFRGFIKPDELANYYRQCSVAVVSSVWPEPFGMVGPEAMRHGLPVVAFDVGGISEWLINGVNGYLVPRMDRARFAARVQELLCDKILARQMGERGRQMVCEEYELSAHITALERMFDRVNSEAKNLAT